MRKTLCKNKLNIYVLVTAILMFAVLFAALFVSYKASDTNQLTAYVGRDKINITDGWNNTSDKKVNIQNLKYFHATGTTPYVFYYDLPEELSQGMDLGFLTKDMGVAVFASNPDKETLTQIDYHSVTEENNELTKNFQAALNQFVYHNAESYYFTDALLVSCGEGVLTKGTGNSLHTIDLNNYNNQRLYMVLFPVYESSKVSNLYLQDAQYYTQDMIQDILMEFIISLILIVMAAVILTMALFMENNTKKVYCPLGMFIMDVGLWTLVASRMFDFILGTSEFINAMSFYLLMFVPVFGSIFLDAFAYKKHKSIANLICPVVIIQAVIVTILNYTGIRDLYETNFVTEFVICVMAISAVYLFLQDIKFRKDHNFERIHGITIINLIILMICSIMDMMRHLSWILIDGAQDNAFYTRIGMSILCLGILTDLYSSYMMQHKKASLAVTFKDIAFLDEMTGIGNRAAFARYELEVESMIKDLSAKADDSQSIIYTSIDLNDLKSVNDTQGHAIGDVYIKTAARILRTSFHQASIYRVGGDEFSLFIIGKDARNDYEGGLRRMIKAQAEYNATSGSNIHIEFAYGSSEWRYFDMRSLHQVEVDADKAMYVKKREMKDAR